MPTQEWQPPPLPEKRTRGRVKFKRFLNSPNNFETGSDQDSLINISFRESLRINDYKNKGQGKLYVEVSKVVTVVSTIE